MELTLDPTMLRRIRAIQRSDEPDFVTTVIDLFLESSATQLDALRNAVRLGESEAFRRAVHGLKGTSFGIGAVQLARLCEALERQEDAAIMGNGDTHLARIEAEYTRLVAALEQERLEENEAGE